MTPDAARTSSDDRTPVAPVAADPLPSPAQPAEQRPPAVHVPLWRRVLFSKFLWLAVVIVVGGFYLHEWVISIGGPDAFRERFGIVAPIVSTIALMTFAIAPALPSDFVAISNGTLYGFWGGFALTWFGWFLSGLIQYCMGWMLSNDFDLEENLAKMPRWMRKLPVDHPLYLILVRQIPGAGADFGSLLPGAVGVPWWRHLWCLSIAIIPGAMLYAAIGHGLIRRWSEG